MKNLIIALSLAAAVLTSGCSETQKSKKEWTLAPTATIQSIQAERDTDLAGMRKVYKKQLDQLVCRCENEKIAAKAVWQKGLISTDACNARIEVIEDKYDELFSKNTQWSQDRQSDILDRFDAKVELWEARK